jgi:Peptidase of plants and bacteria
VVAVLALVAAALFAADAQAARKTPTLRQVIPTRSDGSVARGDALKAFAATVAPLPGVEPPKRGYPYLRSASGPIRWVLAHWSKLTSAQRAAVQKALPGIAVPGGGRAAPAPRAKQSKFTLTQLQLLAEQARNVFNKYFSPDLTMQVVVDTDAVWKELDAGAYATFDGSCRVAFPTTIFDEKDEGWVKEILIHELAHCYQFQIGGTDDMPPWLGEGAAEYVMARVSLDPAWLGPKYVSANVQDDWKTYFKNFTAPLQQQKYSAQAYFAHFAHTYGEAQVFPLITAMFQATSGKQAYDLFTSKGGPSLQLLNTLAPSGTRLKPLGKNWDTSGPSIPGPASARYNPPSVAVGAGKLNLTAAPYGRTVVGLNPVKGAEAVKVENLEPSAGYGLLHHEKGDASLQDGTLYFCAGKLCKCPDGREVDALGDDAYVGFFAHKKQARVRLTEATLAQACNQSPSAMVVSGAFSMTVKERGSCGVKSSEMGSKPLNALWTTGYTPQRPQGLGMVDIQVGGAGPGTYPADIDAKPPYGTARVTKFGDADGGGWSPFNRVGKEPPVRNFGSVTVNTVTKDGASGTVSMVLFAEPPEADSKVTISGRWSCVPFDKVIPSAG